MENGANYLQKLKEYRHRAYQKRKEKMKQLEENNN
jgi:hypothetical protein